MAESWFRCPALGFAACRDNYNRASGADVLGLEVGGWKLEPFPG